MITPEESWVLFDGSNPVQMSSLIAFDDGPENHLSVNASTDFYVLSRRCLCIAAHHGFGFSGR